MSLNGHGWPSHDGGALKDDDWWVARDGEHDDGDGGGRSDTGSGVQVQSAVRWETVACC